MAVTEAIETSVRNLVVEGIRDGLFTPRDSTAARTAIAAYEDRKERAARRDYFDRLLQPNNRPGLGVEVGGSGRLYQGDYVGPEPRPAVSMAVQAPITSRWAVGLEGLLGRLRAADGRFNPMVLTTTAQLDYYFVPEARVTPFLRAEGGVQSHYPYSYRFGDTAFVQGGASLGLEYMIDDRLGLSTSIGAQYALSDDVDGQVAGTHHDSVWRADVGLTYYGLF